jgi:hypothetical protein
MVTLPAFPVIATPAEPFPAVTVLAKVWDPPVVLAMFTERPPAAVAASVLFQVATALPPLTRRASPFVVPFTVPALTV